MYKATQHQPVSSDSEHKGQDFTPDVQSEENMVQEILKHPDPRLLTPNAIMALQRQVGNRQVQRLIQRMNAGTSALPVSAISTAQGERVQRQIPNNLRTSPKAKALRKKFNSLNITGVTFDELWNREDINTLSELETEIDLLGNQQVQNMENNLPGENEENTGLQTPQTNTPSQTNTGNRQGKKKKKYVTLNLNDLPSTPKQSINPGISWSQMIQQPITTTKTTTQNTGLNLQPIEIKPDLRNDQIQQIINQTRTSIPNGWHIDLTYEPPVTDDTVYYYLTITKPIVNQNPNYNYQPTVTIYELEIHYHPRPTTQNWIHVKKRAGTSAGNRLVENRQSFNHYFLQNNPYKSTLREGQLGWENQNQKQATQPIPH